MSETSLYRRHARRGAREARPTCRRLLAAPLLILLTAAAMMLAPSLASADSSSTLTVIGTSDVSDSGLVANVIQPDFQAAYPQFTFKYIGPPPASRSRTPRAATAARAR